MDYVTVRELREKSGEIWQRVEAGEEFVITRNGKPFALLCRLEHLGGVEALRLFQDAHIQVVIPERRINYITPKMLAGEKVGGSPFHSVWVTCGLDLPRDILYVKERVIEEAKSFEEQL